ncbi:UNVERIFIED_CONTAM: hypothetical protein K2H54_012421 [Gekko kuhli]
MARQCPPRLIAAPRPHPGNQVDEPAHPLSVPGREDEASRKNRRFLPSNPAAEQHVFKQPAPYASLLGLNLLATQKHREEEHQAGGNSVDGKDGPVATQEQPLPHRDEGKGDGQAASWHNSHKIMHYRSVRVETPSHTGVSARSSGDTGVSVRSRQQDQERHEQGAASSERDGS